jgi:glycosyltransferase involved in cell wall biosynthesis
MKIRLIGQANDSGIGTHFQHYSTALKQINGMESFIELINFQDNVAIAKSANESAPDDINIAFIPANLNDFYRGYNVNWSVFESTIIPEKLLEVIKKHEAWIPSEWGRKIAIENGVDLKQIEVVPEGVDNNLFHPYFKPQHDKFRFLLIGKYEQRKSMDESIDAFTKVFGNNPNVELIIKSDFFKDPELKKKELDNKIESTGVNNIKLIWGYQTVSQIAELYRSCNVFLFPTKAEGWGLPLIEAAACGLPLITTFYSGQTEFIQDIKSSCILVDYQLKPIDCKEYQSFYPAPDNNYGKWAVSTVDSIAHAIKQAHDNYPALLAQSTKTSKLIRTKYSWANSAIKSLEILKKHGLL